MRFDIKVILILFAFVIALPNFTISNKLYDSNLLPKKLENISYLSINLFNDCFIKCNSVILMGNWKNESLKNFNFKAQLVTHTLLEIGKPNYFKNYTKETYYKINDADFENLPIPAKYYIVISLSLSVLKTGLNKLKNSVYWNQHGNYIIENLWSENSCKDAYIVLKMIWQFEILSAIFICRDLNNVYFYTFNPFSDEATSIWTRFSIYEQNNGHPFTVFNHLYNYRSQSAGSLCESLYFDKTLRLGGYPLKVIELISSDRTLPYEIHRYGVLVSRKIVYTLWQKLDGFLNKSTFPSTQRGSLDKNGTPSGLLKEMFHGKYDMQLNLDYARDFWRNQVWTFIESGICYITKKNVFVKKNTLLKIFSVKVWISLVTISTISAWVLKHLTRMHYIKILINLLRGVLGVPMLYEPKQDIRRIIFFTFALMFININLLFQSKLNSLLASPAVSDLVKTRQDLQIFRYKVCAEERYTQYFMDHVFEDRMIVVNNTKQCLDLLKTESNMACVCDCWACSTLTAGYNHLRLITDPDLRKYFVYLYRNDFPLRKVVQRVYGWMFESGILSYIQKYKIRTRLNSQGSVKALGAITIQQFTFALKLLVYGLFLVGLLCFLELFVYYKGDISSVMRREIETMYLRFGRDR